MIALSRSFAVVVAVLAANACAFEPPSAQLQSLRQMPADERAQAFARLGDEDKVDLFFQANRRHPPYTGLNNSFSEGGKLLLAQVRSELDVRGGTPEVLSFMNIVADTKRRGNLSSADVRDLRVEGICKLAKQSQYCPELEAQLLSP